MNNIDSAIKDDFAELVAGAALVLDAEAIDRWARWITKIFLSYQTAYSNPIARSEDYLLFHTSQAPLPDTQIYLGLGEDLPWAHLHSRRPMMASDILDRSASTPAMQIWTAVFGQLVVQLIQSYGLPVPIRPDAVSYARLWPGPYPPIDLRSLTRLDAAGVAELTKFKPLFDADPDDAAPLGR